MVLPTIAERFADSSANDASHRTRQVMNDTAAAMHADYPWLGVGPNNFAEAVNWSAYSKYIDVSQHEKGHRVDYAYKRGIVESHYWQIRSEMGWLGYVSFMMILLLTVIQGVIKSLTNRSPQERMLAIGITMGLLANYGQSLIEHTLVNHNNLALWMILTGLLIRLPWRSARTEVLASDQQTDTPAEQDSKQPNKPSNRRHRSQQLDATRPLARLTQYYGTTPPQTSFTRFWQAKGPLNDRKGADDDATCQSFWIQAHVKPC